MIKSEDFATGCLVLLIIILCAALIPILFFLFKLSLVVIIPIVIIVGAILGIAILGKITRWIFSKKSNSAE